jgi:glucose/arabinose dehydrogenase
MAPFRSLIVLAALPAQVCLAQPPSRPAGLGEGAVAKRYGELCAACHGPNLEGGRAPSLLDDTWTFGGDDKSLAESIREGRPGTLMAPFKAALTDLEIRALVVFIREQAGQARTQGQNVTSPVVDTVVQSEQHAFKLETVVDGLDTPWGLAFLPDGRLLVSERPGRLRVIAPGQPLGEPIAGTPAVWAQQDGGMMDVALHPDYASNGWVYLAYSDPGTAGASMTAIVRGRVREGRWVDQQSLYAPPRELYWADNTHFGSRFLFDRAGHLFYSIGDRGHEKEAQDLSRPNGKIHRVQDDGRVPPDNPFVARAGAQGSIWSYGNRNVQGLAFHPVTGELWASEHGPRGGDELNLIEPGHNYGWPAITFGINYDGTPVSDRTEQEGMEQPVVQWTPSIGVCGIAFYSGDRFPRWKNDLFVTGLVGQELLRLVTSGHKVVHQEVLFQKIGRVRTVATGPDGYLYVVLNNPGRIVRLVPAP